MSTACLPTVQLPSEIYSLPVLSNLWETSCLSVELPIYSFHLGLFVLQTPWQRVNQMVQQDLTSTCQLAVCWITCNGKIALLGRDVWQHNLCVFLSDIALSVIWLNNKNFGGITLVVCLQLGIPSTLVVYYLGICVDIAKWESWCIGHSASHASQPTQWLAHAVLSLVNELCPWKISDVGWSVCC